MNALMEFLRIELWLFLAALALIIAYQVLTGRIKTEGLLSTRRTVGRSPLGFSPGRLQLLTFTMAGALAYVVQVAQNPQALPDVPAWALWVVAASNGAYLGGKGAPLIAEFMRRIGSTADPN